MNIIKIILGANGGGPDAFVPQITSYDYDAPMTEAGDITSKYLSIKKVISKVSIRLLLLKLINLYK